MITSFLQFVSVELSELSEYFGLVLNGDARPRIHHLHSQHSHWQPDLQDNISDNNMQEVQ